MNRDYYVLFKSHLEIDNQQNIGVETFHLESA